MDRPERQDANAQSYLDHAADTVKAADLNPYFQQPPSAGSGVVDATQQRAALVQSHVIKIQRVSPGHVGTLRQLVGLGHQHQEAVASIGLHLQPGSRRIVGKDSNLRLAAFHHVVTLLLILFIARWDGALDREQLSRELG